MTCGAQPKPSDEACSSSCRTKLFIVTIVESERDSAFALPEPHQDAPATTNPTTPKLRACR